MSAPATSQALLPSSTPCAVVGAGVAGLYAATWLQALEVPFAWLAPAQGFGGMLHRVHNRISNFPPGVYAHGRELSERLAEFAGSTGLSSPLEARLAALDASQGPCRLALEDGRLLQAQHVILATGTRYRTLGVAGESEGLVARCVSQSAARDAHSYAGCPVAVVGGGDAAFENALRLAAAGCDVHLLARRADFAARTGFVDAVRENPRIRIEPIPTVVERIEPLLEGCRLHLATNGQRRELEVRCLFVRIGVEPVLPAFSPLPQLENGYLVVDGEQRTSLAGVLAAGDVTAHPLRSVATAAGQGAAAARTVARLLDLM